MSSALFPTFARSLALALALTGCGAAATTHPVAPVAQHQAGPGKVVIVGDFDPLAGRLHQDPVADAAEAAQRGDLDGARATLEALVAAMPGGWSPVTPTEHGVQVAAWSFEEIAGYAIDQAALPGDREVVWVAPSYSHAYSLLAYIAIEQDDLDHAVELLDRGLALETHTDLLTERALIAHQVKDLDRALAMYTQASELPRATTAAKARAWRGRGGTLVDMGRLDDAERAYQRSLEIEPGTELALNELEYIRRLRTGETEAVDAQIIKQHGARRQRNTPYSAAIASGSKLPQIR